MVDSTDHSDWDKKAGHIIGWKGEEDQFKKVSLLLAKSNYPYQKLNRLSKQWSAKQVSKWFPDALFVPHVDVNALMEINLKSREALKAQHKELKNANLPHVCLTEEDGIINIPQVEDAILNPIGHQPLKEADVRCVLGDPTKDVSNKNEE